MTRPELLKQLELASEAMNALRKALAEYCQERKIDFDAPNVSASEILRVANLIRKCD